MKGNSVFIDTSAFYALMDRSDRHHEEAGDIWTSFIEENPHLQTSNYVVVETLALLQNRLGFEAAELWHQDILSIVTVLWIDESAHNQAYSLWLGLGRRRLSFVDCTSFVTMRHHELGDVFGFDRHFSEQGFRANQID